MGDFSLATLEGSVAGDGRYALEGLDDIGKGKRGAEMVLFYTVPDDFQQIFGEGFKLEVKAADGLALLGLVVGLELLEGWRGIKGADVGGGVAYDPTHLNLSHSEREKLCHPMMLCPQGLHSVSGGGAGALDPKHAEKLGPGDFEDTVQWNDLAGPSSSVRLNLGEHGHG